LNLDEVLRSLNGLSEADKAAVAEQAAQATAGMKFIPSPGPQTEAWFSPADVLLYGGEAGGGKDLALETPILTANRGWQTMGSIAVGDTVFSSSGDQTKVVAKSEVFTDHECYSVNLNTGERFIAGSGHQWLTLTERERLANWRRKPETRRARKEARASRAVAEPKRPNQSAAAKKANEARLHDYLNAANPSARTTEEISASLRHLGKSNHSIEVAGSLKTCRARLPIDPYLFGLWLGDGHSSRGEIGMDAEDFKEVLPQVDNQIVSAKVEADGRKRPFMVVRFECLQARLRAGGLLGCKRIPDEYLIASHDQRLALLQGIMDTDGTATKSGACEIAFSDLRLITDVQALLSSLGVKAALQKPKKTTHKDSHRIKFMASFPVFRLQRKKERQSLTPNPAYVGRRYIVSADRCDTVQTQCIQVDSPDHSYLIGNTLIVTHNSGLLCGLALCEHHRSLIMRKYGTDLEGGGGLIEDLLRHNGTRDGFSGKPPPTLRTDDGRIITFGSVPNLGDEQKYKGRPRDLLGLDEASDFSGSQVRFLMGWVRTEKPDQRTRSVFATNPPTSSQGEWIVEMFRPWLDPTHHNPAKHGELRWYITPRDGVDVEVDGPEPVQRDGETFEPTSRTFIPAKLIDNPFIDRAAYQKQLDALQEPYKSAYRDGNFMAARADDAFQTIPTQWIREAQERWTENPPEHAPMSALAADVAQGGPDNTVISTRYDGWFAPFESFPGVDTPTGDEVAGLIVGRRRNGCPVIVDMGGGYGGATKMRLEDNGIEVIGYKGSEKAIGRSVCRQFGFANKRSMTIWRFREALDPGQDGGSPIALPPDSEMVSDLTATTYEIGPHGVKVLSKEKTIEKLGRSTDKGDSAIMCWSAGPKLKTHGNVWRKALRDQNGPGRKPKVILGHTAARRRRK
jgi:hypothetical protein